MDINTKDEPSLQQMGIMKLWEDLHRFVADCSVDGRLPRDMRERAVQLVNVGKSFHR